MNDDEKKPVVGEAKADEPEKKPEQDDERKVAVKFDDEADTKTDDTDKEEDSNSLTSGVDPEELKKADAIDITAVLSDDDTKTDESKPNEEPEESVSEEERELGRIEGIESAENTKPDSKEEIAAEEIDEAEVMTAPVDLEKETAQSDEAKNPLVEALRKQEQSKDEPKKGKAGLLAGLLGVLLVIALAGAGYFYMQVADTNDQLAAAQSELTSAQATNSSLSTQLKKATAEQQAAADSSGYRTIEGLGVRFKETDATKTIVFGYTVAPADTASDAVALSTKTLVKLTTGTGDAATHPCAFTGNVPVLARYTTDVKVGTSTASKAGKKVGDAYYVYTAPTTACATTETAAQTARDAAAKAIYDSLEVVPSSAATGVSSVNATATVK
ncbi:hypothetical protein GII36_01665 [Candidatus Mycosynbacter amalyticus]|uniref:Uncharacterized protein n=1 Tax=Candidatus Mycosynbacter amalyticus TaxID=2665156 RepID=A0A857ML94_9BACT|nr:hypothetical protein [Candidatus Mycosynbacter amalyticus]QHN42555.1 hypothetical protein GII36_01665 [Candidatus Mycosynbacter amalyticus]